MTDTPLDLAHPAETLLAEGGFAEATVEQGEFRYDVDLGQPAEVTCAIQTLLARGIADFHDEKSGSRLAALVDAL